MNKWKQLLHYLDQNLELLFMTFFYSILCLSVFLQIITRILVASFSWTEEVARFSFVWFTFFGVSYCIKEHSHIYFDLILNRFGEKTQMVMQICIDLVMAAVFLSVLYLCKDFILFSYKKKAPALNVTIAVVNASVIFGMLCCLMRSAQNAMKGIKKLKTLKCGSNGLEG